MLLLEAGNAIRRDRNFYRPGKNYSIYGENSPGTDLKLRQSCAAPRQSILNQSLGRSVWRPPGLARCLRRVSKPRDRVANVRSGSAGTNGEYLMKSNTALMAILFALASSPLWAQQTSPANQPNSPATQRNQQDTETAPQSNPVKMSPINGELMSKLDSKTAKTGDNVVVRTKSSAKTAEGTEIPKGSKLVGHVISVQPSGAGENSQVALQFDHFELKGGQSLPVHSQIESIAPAESVASTSGPAAMGGAAPQAGGSSNSGTGGANGGYAASRAPQGASGDPGAASAGNGAPAAGTVVAKSGNIAIQTTSIPGVLLANNAPGQQDPRMATVSSILLGAKRDVQLNGGTQMVVEVAAAGGGVQ